MAELKRTFSGGAMNKDLDERLLPNGKYRDALNVQVSTSEGADVGALQNILGNKLPYAASIASNLGDFPKVIGSIRRDETECIYWFVVSNDKNLIIEFNQLDSTAIPIVVDTRRVLGFDRENLITGIEILDDFLIWTDNKSEPKMIKVSDWRDYTNSLWTHTQVDGGNFEEKHCTVIKEGPKTAPGLRMSNTTRSGPISGILHSKSFTFFDNDDSSHKLVATGEYIDQDGDGVADSGNNRPLPNAPDSEIIISGTTPDFRVGDKLKITSLNEDNKDSNNTSEIIVSVLEVDKAYPKIFKINIDAIDTNIEQGLQNWKVRLIQKPAMFETKFVRFAYRYKYKDGEYSTISPFSEVAFVGEGFDYDHKKGYNLGMVNQLRNLEIVDWAVPTSVPYGVVEVDILYKDSVSNNIYVVKSIDATDTNSEFHDIGTYPDLYFGKLEITSETIYKVIPSNQILRPYDNVPRKAKAVSVSGNRLMFGNYLENYDLKYEGKDISVKFGVNVIGSEVRKDRPSNSIKSQRTYQLGVVFRDKYGRETPVITDETGSITLNKGFSSTRNNFRVRIESPAGMPDGMETFKYYIKETSQPYYNIAMDRHYPAEDGNVWVAFSSSDRNKINEETFLTIKKQHDSDDYVKDEAKYKVLAIENEAPDFIRQENLSKGILSRKLQSGGKGTIFGTTEGYPLSGNKFIDIKADDWKKIYGGVGSEVSSGKPVHQLSDLNIVIFSNDNKTKNYDIASIQYFEHFNPNGVYRLNLEKDLDLEDVLWIGEYDTNDTTISIEIFQKVTKFKPEFQGRFYTKLQRDIVLENSLINTKKPPSQILISSQQDMTTVEPNGGKWNPSKYQYKLDENFLLSKRSDSFLGWFIHSSDHKNLEGSRMSNSTNTNFFKENNVIKDNTNSSSNFSRSVVPGRGVTKGKKIIEIAFHGWGENTTGYSEDQWNRFVEFQPQLGAFVSNIMTPGFKFRFSEAPRNEKNIYTIEEVCVHYHSLSTGEDPLSRVISYTIALNKEIDWSPAEDGGKVDGSAYYPPDSAFTKFQFINEFREETVEFTSTSPAVFETEPLEVAELDIYYEASGAYSKDSFGNSQGLTYSNCFSFGNGVESDRIRDDFNAPTLSKGVRASAPLEGQYKEVRKKSDIIYSGIYNSTSGVNNLNQFIQAEKITKSINPSYGSIQLMQFRLGDLDVYLEDNVVKVLADRDALFNADGSTNLVATSRVLGAIQPYAGDYGISKNPESYSRYGNRAYFSDKNRGVVLRLSGNGLTPISKYGMEDYFRDKLSVSNIKAVGSYDENKDEYNLTLTGGVDSKNNKGEFITLSEYNDTVSFKEDVNGWASRKSFIQENGLSLNNIYYTFKDGQIWSHNNETRNNFYSTQYESSVKFIFNDAPGSVKSFKTLNYEGSQARVYVDNPDSDNKFSNRLAKSGWWVDTIKSDLQEGQVKTFKDKEGKWFYNILGTETVDLVDLDTREYSVQGLGFASNIDYTPYDQEIEIIVQ